jgi:GDPmannose 4,6-dehydratase
MLKKALITGISGQDGAYLSKLLLSKGYEVYGAARRTASDNTCRLASLGIADKIHFIDFELSEFSNILRTIEKVQPDEIYNLAAQSFVKTSFEQPLFTSDVNAMGVARILEAIRQVSPGSRFYQAGTSEMFGKVQCTPQNETTPFYPRSPYGVAKLYAYWLTVNYRESYKLFAANGILFNHESPLRGLEFVTRKITTTLAQIKQGQKSILELGNLDAKRDWGFAGDYVEGMWLMLQQEQPDDYVLATGKTYSVRYFVECACQHIGFDISWQGKEENEVGIDKKTGREIIKINPEFYRPTEVDLLLGDATKAKQKLGWKPKTTFESLVEMMAKSDSE